MDRRDALVAGLLGAGLIAWLLPAVNYGVDAHHDGIMLKPALDVLSGQSLFRDTFTHYGALTAYLQAVALWIHPTLLAVRIQTAATYVITLLFLYAAWRQLLPRSLTVLSCGLFALLIPTYELDWIGDYWKLMPWSSAYALMFQSIGLYALLRMIRGGAPVSCAVLLGAVSAAVFWCRMPVGVTWTAGVAGIWWALCHTRWEPAGTTRAKVLAGLLLGLGLVHGIMLVNILATGAGEAWWYQNFVWPLYWVNHHARVNPELFVLVFMHPLPALGLLALPALVLGLRWARKKYPAMPSWIPALVWTVVALGAVWQHEAVLKALDLRGGGWTALIPVVIIVQAIVSVVSVFRPSDPPPAADYYLVAAWTGLAVAALPQYYPLADPWHILWSTAPGLGLFVFLFWRRLGWSPRIVITVFMAAFLPAIHHKAVSFVDSSRQPWVTLQAPALLRGMKVMPKTAELYAQVARTLEPVLRQQPDLPGVAIGPDALYLCFLSNRTNPLPYFIKWPDLSTAADEQQRWRYIHDQRPLVFFQSPKDWTAVGDFYRRERYVPLLYVADEALEIAVPKEIANALGLTNYGQPLVPSTPPHVTP